MPRLALAHVSDLHVSRYGEHVTSLRTSLRSPKGKADEDWETLEDLDGWLIQRRVKFRWRIRDSQDVLDVRLLDDEGYIQQRLKGRRDDQAKYVSQCKEIAAERHLTEHARLARSLPSRARVEELLAHDPTNTNLLFLRAAYTLREHAPDWVLVTGDVTDDGIGFDLVEAALAPFIDRQRLLAIPGNHDVYASPPLVVPPHERKDVKKKRGLWAPFAARVGIPEGSAWVKDLGEGVAVCAVDSCTPAWTPMSASGEVTQEEMDRLRSALGAMDERVRICMLHHHVVNPPILHVGRAPWQLGMRLRNAKEVYDFLVEQRFGAVLNGHRHLGYRYHPPFAPLFLSAPSATLGCRTGAQPYYWQLEVQDGEIHRTRERALQPS